MTKFKYLRAPRQLCSRHHNEESHSYRCAYERDRDRILYNKAFLRLMGKTQIYLTSTHDHIRNRLTHTLEVCQIARTIARSLGLDETLTEAIALAHDLGHTPFGHVGERALHQIMNGCIPVTHDSTAIPLSQRGFKHNLQGLRVVTSRLKLNNEFDGLNLTTFTLWGLGHHTKLTYGNDVTSRKERCGSLNQKNQKCVLPSGRNGRCNGRSSVAFYNKYLELCTIPCDDQVVEAWSFEGMVVAVADEIAQRHHDLEDGIEARILDQREICDKLTEFEKETDAIHGEGLYSKLERLADDTDDRFFTYEMSRFIVNLYVTHAIGSFRAMLRDFSKHYGIRSEGDFLHAYPSVELTPLLSSVPLKNRESAMSRFDASLQSYLKARILGSYAVQRMDGVGSYMIRRLAKAFVSNPRQLPDRTIANIMRLHSEEVGNPVSPVQIGRYRERIDDWHKDPTKRVNLLRAVCDYISSMTDAYAIKEYQSLYGSKEIAGLVV